MKCLALAPGWVGEQGANGTALVPGPEKASRVLGGNLVRVVGRRNWRTQEEAMLVKAPRGQQRAAQSPGAL